VHIDDEFNFLKNIFSSEIKHFFYNH
jgi:hypothetical protein